MTMHPDCCGEGTDRGCKRGILDDGTAAHVMVSLLGHNRHVLFHPECCVCHTDPEKVEPAWSKGFAAELAKASA